MDAVVRLPEALRGRLVQAARLHNATELRRCLGEIELLGRPCAGLASGIARALRRYDMEAVLRALGCAVEEPAAAPLVAELGA